MCIDLPLMERLSEGFTESETSVWNADAPPTAANSRIQVIPLSNHSDAGGQVSSQMVL
ncbi:MAG: hypothetical protein FWD71_13890 [Oscillospiraceae bacterium]|nr:hypothetical protein [Oscillospiraceae bacterium]